MTGNKTGSWEMWVALSILNKILRSSIWPEEIRCSRIPKNAGRGRAEVRKHPGAYAPRLAVKIVFFANAATARERKSLCPSPKLNGPEPSGHFFVIGCRG